MARIWIAAAAALLPTPAAAQQVTLEPSAALRCLSPRAVVEAGPEYPFSPFKWGVGGQVKVELVFTHPDRRPEVKILAQDGPKDAVYEFVDAVRAHVQKFRVPCLRPEEGPARLVQEYVFAPDRRQAVWSDPVDPLAAERSKMMDCVQHQSGRKSPDYPERARRTELQGNVLVRMRFDAPKKPPAVEVFSRPNAKLLRFAIEDWVGGYRMPCHSGGPVTGEWVFKFKLVGDSFGFKPLTLNQLLGFTLGIEKQTLKLDTTTMNCPFDLRFTYQQPFLPNALAELVAARPAGQVSAPSEPARPDPTRRPLLSFLQDLQLDLDPRALDSVFGDTALVTVPCIKIDLKPKE